ncbi:MAG: hypothetical protein EAZ27_06700 [Cytophagales bacterium]|nr:MAG: hypothetical protein EAZ27_06700 [Cytophagales bacterium]
MALKEQITIQNKDINVFLNCSIYKIDGFYIGFVPSLKITSKSIISEMDALQQLHSILKKYFEIVAHNEETIAFELQRLGWRDLKPPEIITIPYQYLYSKFNLHHVEFTIPIAA